MLAVGLIVTAFASRYIKADMESDAQREFDFTCNETRLEIVARLEAGAQILRSGAAFLDASQTVSREEWRAFTRRLQLDRHLPGIQGIGFTVLILRAQLDAHVQAIRDEGFPDYQVKPTGAREHYSAIIYLEPFDDRNRRAFGYDMFSEPVRRAAMERARDEDTAALSGKVILVQETDQDVQAGVLMYVPVYRHGVPVETLEQRRAEILGWVYSPYRMNDLMRGILWHWDRKQAGEQIALQVYDSDELTADTLLYDSEGNRGMVPDSNAQVTRLIPVHFAGHRWTLRFTQPGGLVTVADYDSVWFVLFGGTISSLLLSGLMLWRQQRITERRRMEGILREQHKMASVGTLARGMAHEINNPLMGIMNYAELIRDRASGNPSLAEYATEIIAECQRVAKMTQSLLGFTNQRTEMAFESHTLEALVAAVLPSAEETAQAKGIALSCDIPADLPSVSCRRIQLEQVITALLANAMEAWEAETPAPASPEDREGKQIVLSARAFLAGDAVAESPVAWASRPWNTGKMPVPHASRWLRLTVADNGPGIPAAIRERVFDPFFTTKDRTRHAGLGLWISRSCAQEHGGALTFEGGSGTRFYLDLPVERIVDSDR